MKVYSQKWVAATLAMIIAGTNVAPVLAKGTIATTSNKIAMAQNVANAKTGNHNSKFPNVAFRKQILMKVLNKTQGEATDSYVITDADFAKIQAFIAEYPNDAGGGYPLQLDKLSGNDALTGLEHMTSLRKLKITDSTITTLDVSKNVNLTLLQVGHLHPQTHNTPITTLDLSQNTKLDELYILNTDLTALDLSNNTDLKQLYVTDSPITTPLDLSKHTTLFDLTVNDTLIPAMDISPRSSTVSVYNNPKLTQLDVSKNKNLHTLQTGGNALTTLDLSANSGLSSQDDKIQDANRPQKPTMVYPQETAGSDFVVKLADIVGQNNLSKVTLTGTPTEDGIKDDTNKTITWLASKKGTKPTFEYTYDAGGGPKLTKNNNIKVKMTVDLTEPLPIHLITKGTLIDGDITLNPTSAKPGTKVTVTPAPVAGKQLKAGTLKYKKTDDNSNVTDIIQKEGANYTFIMPNYPITIDAEFETIPPTYAITSPTIPADQGTVTSDISTATAGTKVTLTVTPAASKQLKAGSLKYKKTSDNTVVTDITVKEGENYTFTMPSYPITIDAEFENIPTVTVPTLVGGTIISDKEIVPAGEMVTLTVTPEVGYRLKPGTLKYTKDGADTDITTLVNGTPGTYSFTMPAGHVTIKAEFEHIPTVTLPTLVGGAITSDKAIALAGETVILTVTPEAGYRLKPGTLKYTKDNVDTEITTLVNGISGTHSFVMPAGNVTIKAEFELASYPITMGTMTKGTVEVKNPTQTVQWGTVVQVTVKPEVGYVLTKDSLKAGSVALTPVDGGTWADFEFIMPKNAVALNASFEVSPDFSIVVETPKLPAGETPKGDITLNNPTGKNGETVQFTVTPKDGYQLKADSLIVNGQVLNPSIVALAKMRTVEEFAPRVQAPVMGRVSQIFSFIMPPSEVSISAEFELIPTTAPPVTPPTPGTSGGTPVTPDTATPPVAPPAVVPTTPNNPNTGDISGVAGYMAMAMASATGLLGLKKRKEKN